MKIADIYYLSQYVYLLHKCPEALKPKIIEKTLITSCKTKGKEDEEILLDWNIEYGIDQSSSTSIVRALRFRSHIANLENFIVEYIETLIRAYISHYEKASLPLDDIFDIASDINTFLATHLSETFGYYAIFDYEGFCFQKLLHM